MRNFLTFYGEDFKCFIKFSNHLTEPLNGIIIRFRGPEDEGWMYHSPKKKFKLTADIVHYITSNLERDNLQFKIMPSKERL